MPLPSMYQNFIHLSRYARWEPKLKRRETWEETIDRYFNFFTEHLQQNNNFDITEYLPELKQYVIDLNVMPSMRALMSAGKALKRDNVAGYNCSYVKIDNMRAFDEILYILMCGVGVGFSVERQYVAKLPDVPDTIFPSDSVIMINDSRIGWASGLKELIHLLYSGQKPKWDLSKIRPKGTPLKIFGGRASGPEPLDGLFKFICYKFQEAHGRKLCSLEVHDIVCKIAEIVVVGGVRRSALISLSNLSDRRMQKAKTGQWWMDEGQRALSNNSVAYTEKPEIGVFMREWLNLYESKSGERGIFNRWASTKKVEDSERRDPEYEFGCNPCSEIILRSAEFCNLSEVIVREDDTPETLKKKVEMATILGTMQSTLTHFRYIRKMWQNNCDEERLLGVSLTGIMDNAIMNGGEGYNLKEILISLKQHAIQVNKEWAKKLGINASVAITCVKPSGTVSQLVNCASGIHARHNHHYIRTVRSSITDPISKLMIDQNVPYEVDAMNANNYVFSFPMKAPSGCITRSDWTATQQLKFWSTYNDYWCEHKPSVTITVKEYEWLDVAAFVYENFDKMSGVSFLPHSDHVYPQAPYQDCTEDEYTAFLEKMPEDVEWERLKDYEDVDNTNVNNELACTGGGCEVV